MWPLYNSKGTVNRFAAESAARAGDPADNARAMMLSGMKNEGRMELAPEGCRIQVARSARLILNGCNLGAQHTQALVRRTRDVPQLTRHVALIGEPAFIGATRRRISVDRGGGCAKGTQPSPVDCRRLPKSPCERARKINPVHAGSRGEIGNACILFDHPVASAEQPARRRRVHAGTWPREDIPGSIFERNVAFLPERRGHHATDKRAGTADPTSRVSRFEASKLLD